MEKSRLDIIDTNLQHGHERRILRVLLLLLAMTMTYEAFVFYGFPTGQVSEELIDASVPRKTVPVARLEVLQNRLSDLFRRHPEFRAAGRGHQRQLQKLRAQIAAGPRTQDHVKTLVTLVENLHRFTHNPMWENTKPFAELNRELELIFRRLNRQIPDEIMIPALNFTPFRVGELPAPQRDIFAFGDHEGNP